MVKEKEKKEIKLQVRTAASGSTKQRASPLLTAWENSQRKTKFLLSTVFMTVEHGAHEQ